MIVKNKVFYQTAFLFVAQIFGMGSAFMSNILMAKAMGVANFGVYSFTVAVIMFLSIFFEFGYIASISRLLIKNDDPLKEKELFGLSLIVCVICFLFFSLTIFIISFFIDNFFDDKIGEILRISSFCSFGFLVPFYLDLILKGANKIEILSFFYVFQKSSFALLLVVLFFLDNITIINNIISFSLISIISFFCCILNIKPVFTNLKSNFILLQRENKFFGFYNYLSRVIGTGSTEIDKILIALWVSAKDVGLYSLSLALSSPINLLASSFASSILKKFFRQRIDGKMLSIHLLLILAIAFLVFVFGLCVIYFLGTTYHGMLILFILASLATILQAIVQPYNSWLMTNGFGRDMLHISIGFTVSNMIFNLILIYNLNAVGAMLSRILSNFCFLVCCILFYRRRVYDK